MHLWLFTSTVIHAGRLYDGVSCASLTDLPLSNPMLLGWIAHTGSIFIKVIGTSYRSVPPNLILALSTAC